MITFITVILWFLHLVPTKLSGTVRGAFPYSHLWSAIRDQTYLARSSSGADILLREAEMLQLVARQGLPTLYTFHIFRCYCWNRKARSSTPFLEQIQPSATWDFKLSAPVPNAVLLLSLSGIWWLLLLHLLTATLMEGREMILAVAALTAGHNYGSTPVRNDF